MAILGFNGERKDFITGAYHLGNGYRTYNPTLMRFTAPDSFSPFGAGGINSYAYCEGDPINQSDPSGHMSTGAWIGVGLGAISLLLAIPTMGTSLAAFQAGALAYGVLHTSSALLGIASSATGIASGLLEERYPEDSATLGRVSMGLGIGALLSGLGAKAYLKSIAVKRSNIVTMSRGTGLDGSHWVEGNSNNFWTKNGYVYHTDISKSQPRLTVHLHGAKGESGVVFTGGPIHNRSIPIMSAPYPLTGGLTGNLFADVLKANHDLSQFKSIRLIMCHSAEGNPSFAQLVANKTQLPIKAYHGTVTAYHGHYSLVHRIGTFNTIMKGPVFDSSRQIWITPNYQPEIFYPRLP